MSKIYLNVAYADRDLAKRLGARWDPAVNKWYCLSGSALSKVYSWRQSTSRSTPKSVKGFCEAPASHAGQTAGAVQGYPLTPPQDYGDSLPLFA